MKILVDEKNSYLTINGIKYDYRIFEGLGLGGYPEGVYFKILTREDGSITIQRFEPKEVVK